MKFLLDQSAHVQLLPHLAGLGHDVKRIARDVPGGLPDSEVLAIAEREARILIAHDEDFGAPVFAERQPHAGVILFRLGPAPTLETLIARLTDVLTRREQDLHRFIVVTGRHIRVRS